MQAIKKPVQIEYRDPIPGAITRKIQKGVYVGIYATEIEEDNAPYADHEIIITLEGVMKAYPGEHYVVRGVEGEIYPIRRNIFEKTYTKTNCSR